MRRCVLAGARLAAFYTHGGQGQDATLLLQQTTVTCQAWYTRDRPRRFEVEACVGV